MKPFDLEAFKAGQKALTRDGRVVTFVAICDTCEYRERMVVKIDGLSHVSAYPIDGICFNQKMHLVSMVSRRQALIDSYDPEDTWQVYNYGEWSTLKVEPEWHEELSYRLHPHNDLIKAWKKGAKIEVFSHDGVADEQYWYPAPNPSWDENVSYRIKSEPVIHCLAYNLNDNNHLLTPYVMTIEKAQKYGYKIIQEWEV